MCWIQRVLKADKNVEKISNGIGMRFLKLSLSFVFINPYKTVFLMRVLFSTSVFLALFSMFSIIGVWFRRKFISQINSDRILKMVFRQSILISAVLTAYVWLSHLKFFKIWTAIPVLAIAIGAEYYFLVFRGYKKKERIINFYEQNFS
jgi:hypothetical protein